MKNNPASYVFGLWKLGNRPMTVPLWKQWLALIVVSSTASVLIVLFSGWPWMLWLAFDAYLLLCAIAFGRTHNGNSRS